MDQEKANQIIKLNKPNPPSRWVFLWEKIMKKFIEPTDEQRRQLLTGYGVPYDRIVKDKERFTITATSRSTAWRMERDGEFPKRRKMGKGTGWLLSDLLHWMRTLE